MRELNRSITNHGAPVESKQIQALLERYKPHVDISIKELKALIKDSLESVHEHAHALSLNVSQSDFLNRLETIYNPHHRPSEPAHKKWQKDQPDAGAADGYRLKDEDQLQTSARIPETRNPGDILMEGVQELSQIMMAEYEIDTIAMMSWRCSIAHWNFSGF